jgi:hypothetical protein
MPASPKLLAAPVVATIVLEPPTAELSNQAQNALLCADIVHVTINALNAAADDFPPDTLAFVLRNADRIYGMVDCGPMAPGYWEALIDGMTFPKLENGRWNVRLLASDPTSWEARINLLGPVGPFELASPIYFEDTAARVGRDVR